MNQKYALTAVTAALVLVSLACAFGPSTAAITPAAQTPQTTSQATVAPTNTEPSAPKMGLVGDTITQAPYSITLTKVEKNSYFDDLQQAEAGKIYLSVEIIVQSGADTGVSANPAFCRLSDASGYSYDPTYGGKQPLLAAVNDLPKGDRTRGWVTFLVPENVKGLFFTYKPLSSLDKTLIRFDLGM
jgi:hypothetical protein